MLSAILWGGLAAASLLVGLYLSSRGLSNRTIGMVMGDGAGALLSAIAYELIPETLMERGKASFLSRITNEAPSILFTQGDNHGKR